MKKLSVIALAVAACMLFAIPAMAVDVDFSGSYRVRGFYEDNTDLNDDTGSTDAAMDMRLRIEPVIKIHDRLKLTMRFDAHDNRVWGNSGTIKNYGPGQDPTTGDFDLDRVFMDADFDMFALRIGRMVAGTCGIQYCDSDGERDRIKVILKNIDPFYLDYTYEKVVEGDYYRGESDADSDGHWLHGFYSDEVMTYGLMFGYALDKRDNGFSQEFRDVFNIPAGETYQRKFWLFDPYFKGNFGPINVEAEAQWYTGDAFDTEGNGTDYNAWRYILDVSFNFGPGNVGIGYAHADGQDADDEDWTIPGNGLGGTDWEPLLILTHSSANSGLGGQYTIAGGDYTVGNLNSGSASNAIKAFGYDIVYLYGNYAATETVTLNAILGFAWADETNTPWTEALGLTNVDDEYGWEFDIGAKWQVMDNLAYDAKFGYFKAGDLYGDDADDTWAVMHSLVVTF